MIWEASGGNALFVRHPRGALEAGTLRGVWQLRGRTPVTSELASLLDGRIDQLPDDVLHALRLLTFCEPLDLDTLTSVGSDAVGRRDQIRVVASTTAGPSSPLFGELIRRRLGVGGGAAAAPANSFALYATRPPHSSPAIRLAELTLESDLAPDSLVLW